MPQTTIIATAEPQFPWNPDDELGAVALNNKFIATDSLIAGLQYTVYTAPKFTSAELKEGFTTSSTNAQGNAWASKFRDGATDQKNADVFFADVGINYRLVNDAYTQFNTYMRVVRSGYTAVSLTLAATTIALNSTNLTWNGANILNQTSGDARYLLQSTAASTYAPLTNPILIQPSFTNGFNSTSTSATGNAFASFFTTGNTDEKKADIFFADTHISYRLVNDAYSAFSNYIQVTRSGYTATSLQFAATAIGFTGTVTIPAGASISGYLTTASAASTYAPLASPTFTGTVTIPTGASIAGYLTTATAGTTYLTQTNATATYLTIATAGTTYLTQANASTTYLTQANAGTTYLTQANATSTYAPKVAPTFVGSATFSSNSAGLEMGSTSTLNTPYIDFHSSGNNIDFDARILGSGGTATAGNGALLVTAAAFQWNSNTIMTAASVAASYAPLANPTFTGTVQGNIGSFSGGVATHGLTTDLALNVNGTTGNCNIEIGPVTGATATPNLDFLSSGAGLGKQDVRLQATGGSTSVLNQGTLNILSAALQWNGTAIATQSYVTGLGYLTTATAASTYAPLANPTFTGTVTIPANASIAGYLTNSGAIAAFAALSGATFTGTVAHAAGTTTLAPAKFTAGTNLTTPAAGAMEWDGTNLYITQTTGPTRQTFAYLASPTFTGVLTAPTLTLTGANAINANAVGAGIELGSLGTANTPYIDLHSSGLSTDYDVRLAASGGTATSGNGTLTVYGKTSFISSSTTNASDFMFQSTSNTAGAHIGLVGNGTTTPSKYLGVVNGYFRILNNAYSVELLRVDDGGALSTTGAISTNLSGTYAGVAFGNQTNTGAAGGVITALNATSAAVDNRRWQTYAPGDGTLLYQATNDANTVSNTWLSVSRSGATPTQINLNYPTFVSDTFITGSNCTWMANAWTSVTVAGGIAANSGTITGTHVCRYKKFGRTVFLNGTITITDPGTSNGVATSINTNLPFACATSNTAYFRENAINGNTGFANTVGGTTNIVLTYYNYVPISQSGAIFGYNLTYEATA